MIVGLLDVVSVTTAWQRLRDEHGLQAGLTAFRQYVHLEFPGTAEADAVTVWRGVVAPGSEAQIDYGYLGPPTGRRVVDRSGCYRDRRANRNSLQQRRAQRCAVENHMLSYAPHSTIARPVAKPR